MFCSYVSHVLWGTYHSNDIYEIIPAQLEYVISCWQADLKVRLHFRLLITCIFFHEFVIIHIVDVRNACMIHLIHTVRTQILPCKAVHNCQRFFLINKQKYCSCVTPTPVMMWTHLLVCTAMVGCICGCTECSRHSLNFS